MTVAAAGMALALGEATSVADGDVAAAEALFRQGRELMKDGDHDAACAKFEASFALDASVGAMLNLGECRRQQGNLASAWSAFRRAAALAHRIDDRERERFARSRAGAVEPELSYLTIEVPDDVLVVGLSVTLDGDRVERALWDQRVPRDPGEYVIRATAPDHEPWETRVVIPARRGDVRVTVRPLSTSVEPPEAPPGAADTLPGDTSAVTSRRGLSPGRKIAAAGGALGLAGVIAGSIYGLQARSKWHRAIATCERSMSGPLCTERGVALGEEAQAAARVSTVALSAGVAVTAASALLWYLAPAPARVEPVVDGTAIGVSLATRF